MHGNKRFSCSACNPRGSPCKQREESADRLSRSKLTLKPCRLFHAKSKKKKERKRTSLVLYVSIPPPISRAPSIKPDRSGSVPREANSIRVSCDRGDAKLEAGLSIQPRVSLRESKKWFEALHRYSSFPDFRAIFQFESIAPASDLKDISHILIMSKLPSLFQFSRVYLLSMIWTLFSKRSNKYRSILF